MPVLSAAAYDSLLLEKVKLVIQAVLQDPKSPQTTFEDFVVGFDVAQPLAYKLFDLLIQETTKRRPRKVNVEPSTSTSSGAAGAPATARRTRTARSHSPDPIDMLRSRRERILRITDSVSSDDDDDDGGGGARSRYGRAVATARAPPPPPRVGRADDDVSPSTRLRQRQLAELFGSALRDTTTNVGFPQNLADLLDDDNDRGGARQSRFSPSSASIPSALFAGEPLPTHQELWSMLVDDPFPPGGEASFFGFRMALNSTQAFAAAPVRAPSLRDLLDELADRDLAFPIRLSNLLAARNGNNDPARLRTGAGSTGSSGSGDEAPAEGIWRASFVEHLDDGTTREVPISLGTIGDVAAAPPSTVSTTDGPTFAAFAERRRAERRARARGGGPADLDSDAMNVDSPAGASSSTSGETPLVTVSQASTPATSAAHSPAPSTSASASLGAALAELCPPPARQQQLSTVAPTSASLAEAHFRSQRAIAPLPSHRGPSSSPSWTDPAGAALVADAIRDAIPDDVLSQIRDSVGAGQLDYDPSTGWSGPAVSNFAADQLDVVARTLVQIRRLRIRGSEEGGVDIEF